jgi:hypothetical protein
MFLNKPFVAEVDIQPANGPFRASNFVKKYIPIAGQPQAQARPIGVGQQSGPAKASWM